MKPSAPSTQPSARRRRTLPVLAAHGLVKAGTEIELVPEALPVDAARRDPRLFRATIVQPEGLKGSVRWSFDGQAYSLSELTKPWEHLVRTRGLLRYARYGG
jgi:hypothetical protein